MFALRGIAVSLSVYVLAYSLLCLLITAAWRVLARHGSRVSQISVLGFLHCDSFR